GAAGDGSDETGGNEHVRVDDVGAEAASLGGGAGSQRGVAAPATFAAVEDGPGDRVATALELALGLRDEHAQVGSGGAGIHLRHEQDPHGRDGDAFGTLPSPTRRGSVGMLAAGGGLG